MADKLVSYSVALSADDSTVLLTRYPDPNAWLARLVASEVADIRAKAVTEGYETVKHKPEFQSELAVLVEKHNPAPVEDKHAQ